MKKIFLFIILSIVITSCSTSQLKPTSILSPTDTYTPTATQEPTVTSTSIPELTPTEIPTPTLTSTPEPIYVTLRSPFAEDCGDGVTRIFSNDSFNAPGLDHQFDNHHGHVDLYTPIGCDVVFFKGEVISPASGNLYGDGDSYQLRLPEGVLLNGIVSALAFSGEEDIDLHLVTQISLDFGHIEPFLGTTNTGFISYIEKGQPFADFVLAGLPTVRGF